MRCSTCMAVLIERDDTVICPNCESIHGAGSADAYQSDFDTNLSRPSSLARRVVSVFVWGAGVIVLLVLGGAFGWTLRDQGLGPDDFGASSLLAWVSGDEEETGQQSEAQLLPRSGVDAGRFVPVTGRADPFSLVLTDRSSNPLLANLSRTGELQPALALSDTVGGTLKAAARHTSGTLAVATLQADELRLSAWNDRGAKLWTVAHSSGDIGQGHVVLHTLSSGFVLILPSESSATSVAHGYSIDGRLIWQHDLGGRAESHLSLYRSPFDELIALMRDNRQSSAIRVQSISAAGLSGFETELNITSEERVLAATVDPSGVLLVLLSGAPPRLMALDPFGDSVGGGLLIDVHALVPETPCRIDSQQPYWRLACLRSDRLDDYVFDATRGELNTIERASEFIPGARQLLTIADDHLFGLGVGDGDDQLKPFALALRSLPEPEAVSMPDLEESLPDAVAP